MSETMTYTQNTSPVHTLVSTPVTIVLTGGLLCILLTTFFTFFVCGCCVKKLLTAWYNHRNRARNFMRSSNPPENAGLDPKIVQSFPTFPYSSLTDHGRDDQCSICLTDFMDEDNLRLITTCRHSFHTICIDLWFESHKTCPVCRCEPDQNQTWQGKSPVRPEMDHVRSENNESLRNSISIIIQEHSPDQNLEEHLTSDTLDLTNENESYERRMEASNWRFWRSHSTGRSIVKTDNNEEEEEGGKFLLRCLENVNVKITRGHCQTESCIEFGQLSCYDRARECRWLGEPSIEIQQQN